MKNFLFLTYFISQSLFANILTGKHVSSDYESAKSASSYLKYTIETTKLRYIKSNTDGFVKKFSYSYNFNKQNKIIRNMKLVFYADSMDSDSEDMDKKLKNFCLSAKKYPLITVKIRGPVFLKEKREKGYPGKISIRGQYKDIYVKLKHSLKKDKLSISAISTMSLKELEIPDPSILVAKLSDEIKVELNITDTI